MHSGIIVALGLVCATQAALGNTAWYWDTNTTDGLQGGSGTWSTGAANWATANSGTATQSLLAWDNSRNGSNVGAAARFNAGSGTVTVQGTVDTASLDVNVSGYTFTGAKINITGDTAGGMNIASGVSTTILAPIGFVNNKSQTWNVGTGGSLLISGSIATQGQTWTLIGAGSTALSGVVAGASPIISAGPGVVTINGGVANTFTGGMAANYGTLLLDFSNIAVPANLVATGNSLGIGGGLFSIKGKSGAVSTSQTLGNVTVSAGAGQLLIDPNGGTGTTLNLGSITAASAGGSLLMGTARNPGAGTVTITTASNKDATGVYGGRIVFTDGTVRGYDWATTASAGPTFTLSAYTGYAALPASAASSTTNYKLTGGLTLTAGETVNSLKIENPAAGQTLALGSNVLTLNGGGLLVTGSNAFTISGAAGAAALLAGNYGIGGYELIIHQYNTAGLTISAGIGDNGANATALTKTGTSTLTLGASNSFSGATTIAAGTLVLGNTAALINSTLSGGAGTLSFGSLTAATLGGLVGSSNLDLDNTASAAVTLTVGNNGASTAYSGLLTGSGALVKIGAGLFALSGNNTFTGPTTLSGGTLLLGNAASLQNSTLTMNGGAIGFGALATPTLGGLSGSTNIVLNSSATTAMTLTVGSNNADNTFTGSLTGTGAFTKTGTGILTLTGNNTYTGITTISPGPAQVFPEIAGNALFIGNGGGGASLASPAVRADGIFAFNNGDNQTYAGAISGEGGLLKFGSGMLTLTGSNTYGNNTLVYEGTLLATTPAALANYANSNWIFLGVNTALGVRAGGSGWNSAQIDTVIGNLFFANSTSGFAIDTTNGNFTYASDIVRGMSLIKLGPNTLTLSGTNINLYGGSTAVTAGTLRLAPGVALGAASIAVAPGATFAPQASSSAGGSLNLATSGSQAATLDLTDGVIGTFKLAGGLSLRPARRRRSCNSISAARPAPSTRSRSPA